MNYGYIYLQFYLTGKFKELYYSKGSHETIWLREHGVNYNFQLVVVYNFIVNFEMQINQFFHENLAERVVILPNGPKGRLVTLRPAVGGIPGR